MEIVENPYRGLGLQTLELDKVLTPSVDAISPVRLVENCPIHVKTPIFAANTVARKLGLGTVWLKDERARMGLGSFKALGAAYVIAHRANTTNVEHCDKKLTGQTFVAASAGNHGLSVAAGARIFGARAVIYLATSVPEAFADKLRGKGAQVERAGATYEESMAAADRASSENGWTLLSDAAWPGYTELPHRLMEGYLIMAAEIEHQMSHVPTHIFLQAGVGGMAAALAAYFRKIWKDAPKIIIVEPNAAPALIQSIQAGKPVVTTGPVSNMGRLDCKEPSLIALKGLAWDADYFMTISDDHAMEAVQVLSGAGIATTPSGGAGLAGLLVGAKRDELALNAQSRILAIISEEALP
jgi:diaminopropionate ammonia-lyase